MRVLILSGLFLLLGPIHAQPNCNAYLIYGDTLKHEACKKAENRRGHYQFSKEYQIALDQALAIDSTWAYAYRAKSVAYLKSGDFITWKKLMDKAVKYNLREMLEYRSWCRYQFFKDYKGAIEDAERLFQLSGDYAAESANGDYNLNIARGLWYRELGQIDKGLQIMEEQLDKPDHYVGIYDYLHLGVIYFEFGRFQDALTALKRQEAENDIAENRFYKALTLKALGNSNEYTRELELALAKYSRGLRMFDPYVEMIDQIYQADLDAEIETEIKK